MASRNSGFYISGICDMAKINTMIKFLIVLGIIIFIDNELYISKKSVEMIILNIFQSKFGHRGVELYYTSIYASIAIVLSSDLGILKKIIYSIGLFLSYVLIFAFIITYIFRYGENLLYLWFMTMLIPILLWKYIIYKE